MTTSLIKTRRQLVLIAIVGISVVCSEISAFAGWNPFLPGSPIHVGPQSGALTLADFNGDGKIDLLANHPLHKHATLLLGDGKGAFPMRLVTTIPFEYDPAAIAVGDVNSDGRPDLAVTSRDGSAAITHVLLNSDGDLEEAKELAFSAGQAKPTGWKPSIALKDINGDKILDVVSADGRVNSIDVFYGDGKGRFSRGQTIVLEQGWENYTYAFGDLNDDGRVDLVTASAKSSGAEPDAGKLTIFFGDENGELVEAVKSSARTPAQAKVATMGDVDGDGIVDIVLTSEDSLIVLTQDRSGNFSSSEDSPFAMGHSAFGMVAVPVGFAGNDVLIAATVDSLDLIYANEGEFHRACGAPLPAGPGAYNVALGDLNGDGKDDVVANSFEGEDLTVLLSN